MNFLLVFLGGGVGSLMRYLLGSFINRAVPLLFPLSTLTINVLGCLAIGVITVFAERTHFFTLNVRLLLITGFLGGFTTFSAFGLETVALLKRGDMVLAFGNISLSIILGLTAVWIGFKLANLSN